MLFRRFYAPILQDLQPAKCDTCRQARLCLRSGGNSSGLQEAGLAYQKKHLNGKSPVNFLFVLLSPSLRQLATAKFGKFACSLAFVALSSNSTSCPCSCPASPGNNRCLSSRITTVAQSHLARTLPFKRKKAVADLSPCCYWLFMFCASSVGFSPRFPPVICSLML